MEHERPIVPIGLGLVSGGLDESNELLVRHCGLVDVKGGDCYLPLWAFSVTREPGRIVRAHQVLTTGNVGHSFWSVARFVSGCEGGGCLGRRNSA